MDHLKVKVHHIKRRLSKDESSKHNNQFVLITNGTGYISTWIIRQFLSNGYRVRTTVQSNIEAQDVKDTHSQYAYNLETAVITRIDFEDALKDIDGVVCTELEEWRSLLEGVAEKAPQVQRVVVTSSLDAVVHDVRPSQVFTGKDWNPNSEENGLREFMRKTRDVKFSLVTICPAMVWGPLAHKIDVEGVCGASEEVAKVWRILEGGDEGRKGGLRFGAFVDVRNVAQAHLRAYEREGEDEKQDEEVERYIVSSGPVTYAQVCSTLKQLFPEKRLKIPDPKQFEDEGEPYAVDNTKTKEELFISFIGLEDCLRDMGQSLNEIEEAGRRNLRYDGQEWFSHV